MPIADWFSARDARRYTRLPEDAPAVAGDVADGVWVKCESCKHTLYEGELFDNAHVCPHCGHHFDVEAPRRIELLADEGSFSQIDAELTSLDPLGFSAAKTYAESLEGGRAKSGLNEAVLTGTATIEGTAVVLGVMDFRFIGASMGSVVGEKIARAFEHATRERLPIVLVTASGGARMQEGMFSLMQMAKTSAAARRHLSAGLPYVSVLTNPTYGGVTASFPVLADVIVAEPGASIGFTGPRIIEQTMRQKLPKGFQTAEFMLEHGLIDEVVARPALHDHLALLLSYLVARVSAAGGER
jgi:acetyl-CoA carboxylase carboxyl transferase subunit beta